MYQDYAISETLFHWQSQNSTSEDRGKGLSYINHVKLGKRFYSLFESAMQMNSALQCLMFLLEKAYTKSILVPNQ